MQILQDIWAKKPKETLVEHTNMVIQNILELKKRYQKDLPNQEFWNDLFVAALFHDFGKISDNFQNMIQPSKKTDWDNFLRHEFLSGMYLFANNTEYYKINPLSLFAVFSHHKLLTIHLFEEKPHIEKKIQEQYFDEFISYAKAEAKKHFQKICFTKTAKNYILNEKYSNILRAYQKCFLPLKDNLTPKDRTKYIYYKALLNIADWSASGHRELEAGLLYQKNYLAQKIIEKLKKEGKTEIAKNFNYRKFQENSLYDGNVLAIAPTGSGKTEAALLWASQKEEFNHIFYLLPTRVTSNAIFKRLCTYFGKEKVALVHSSAFFQRKEIDDQYSEKEYAFIDKAFFKNITVCTIDQILTQGFNLGFWEVKTFHQLKARIIIDEIHLYQPYTLGLIIATIRYLQEEFGAKFFIMTATMPDRLKKLLQKSLNSPKYISDTEFLQKSRNKFEIRKKRLDEITNEIEKKIEEEKKVLLVLNTVDSAIQAYKHFKPLFKGRENNILCYHSRFIQKDRVKKEEEIYKMEAKPGGNLLVATQVVEVSLDIDFDMLFTENAPIDAIIQRAGRINRKRGKKDTKVIVFKHSGITEKYVYDTPNILSKTFKILEENQRALTEHQLLKLVDEVYCDYDVETIDNYKKGLIRHKEIQMDQNYILDLESPEEIFTREGLDTINVIPDKYQEKLKEKSIMEKAKHEVAISIKRFKSIKYTEDDKHKWIKYVDVDYDFETGLKFKEKEEKSSSSTKFF